MSTDPRVTAVAEALDTHWQRFTMDSVYQCVCGVRGYRSEWPQHLATVAVAQLDLIGPPPEPSDISAASWANLLRVVSDREDRLRERISKAIDHEWNVKADEFGRRTSDYEEGTLDGLERAASIVRETT